MIEIIDIEKWMRTSEEMDPAICPLCGENVDAPGPIHIGVAYGRQAIIHRGCYEERVT